MSNISFGIFKNLIYHVQKVEFHTYNNAHNTKEFLFQTDIPMPQRSIENV